MWLEPEELLENNRGRKALNIMVQQQFNLYWVREHVVKTDESFACVPLHLYSWKLRWWESVGAFAV